MPESYPIELKSVGFIIMMIPMKPPKIVMISLQLISSPSMKYARKGVMKTVSLDIVTAMETGISMIENIRSTPANQSKMHLRIISLLVGYEYYLKVFQPI